MSQFTDDLLAQADALLIADPRRPKQANLRRAVSSSYYALFHFLIEEATIIVVGGANTVKPLRQLVGRGFSHTAMKNASSEIGKPTPTDLLKPFWPRYQVASSRNLQRVAGAFVELQQERHRADYDLAQSFTRDEAQALVNQAREAMNDWNRLKTGDRELAKFYAFCLLCWNNWKGRG